MNVLVIGSGAREHALAWRLRHDRSVGRIACAPGNPGIASVAEIVDVSADDVPGAVAAARRLRADLTVVGPEVPLAAGIADRFAREGLPLFGPTRAAARLETSKSFAKGFMSRHRIPTASYRICASADAATRAVAEMGLPVVLKADGLAAGKGVVVAEDFETANRAIDAAMVERCFGDAGGTLVVEEFLAGEEASFFCVCDGVRAMPVGTAQDHKRAFDGDRGPNTGGMGAFAPSPLVDRVLHRRVLREIVEPTLEGLREEGTPYRGFLYVGLMLTPGGPQVVEFNARFGDPEAQVVLPTIAGDLASALLAAACGRLEPCSCVPSERPHVGIVLASGGYPGAFECGKPLSGVDAAAACPGVQVFHAGTAFSEGRLVTSGGRVLTVVGSGETFVEATARAYAAADLIAFEGVHLRRDIGRKATAAHRELRPQTAR